MASPKSNDYFNFPYFPPPHTFQPPPPHPFQPPPPAAKPPSPSRSPPPPPTPSHPFAPPPPHLRPPPPPHVRPPPPHVRPPPPAPSPSNHPTVIVIVFISFGGLFFLAFLAACVFCFIKRKKKTVQGTDLVHVNEHREVKEAIIAGPRGSQAVILSIEDDVQIDEVIRKDEKFGKGLHAKSAEGKSGSTLEEGTSSPGFDHDHHLENKA